MKESMLENKILKARMKEIYEVLNTKVDDVPAVDYPIRVGKSISLIECTETIHGIDLGLQIKE